MKRTLTIAVLLTAGLSATAHASDDSLTGWSATGNGLVSACNEITLTAECYAYIHGALDGFLTGGLWQLPAEGGFVHNLCVPDGVTNDQVRKVILLYADKHPEKLHMAAANLIAVAVKEAWGISSKGHPCP